MGALGFHLFDSKIPSSPVHAIAILKYFRGERLKTRCMGIASQWIDSQVLRPESIFPLQKEGSDGGNSQWMFQEAMGRSKGSKDPLSVPWKPELSDFSGILMPIFCNTPSPNPLKYGLQLITMYQAQFIHGDAYTSLMYDVTHRENWMRGTWNSTIFAIFLQI